MMIKIENISTIYTSVQRLNQLLVFIINVFCGSLCFKNKIQVLDNVCY